MIRHSAKLNIAFPRFYKSLSNILVDYERYQPENLKYCASLHPAPSNHAQEIVNCERCPFALLKRSLLQEERPKQKF